MTQPDLAIVGGGLRGLCLALRASRAGARVVLYDAGSTLGAIEPEGAFYN